MKPLRVLNTRPLHQNTELKEAIQAMGWQSINLPLLTITPTNNEWLARMPNLADVSVAIFISSNAVTYFFSSLKQQHIVWPNHINIIAIGSATAKALSNLHIHVHCVPNVSESEHLVQLDELNTVHNKTILLIKGLEGRTLISQTLASRGADLIPLCVYQRISTKINQEYIHTMWRDDKVDIILFTSQQAMQHLFSLLSKEGQSWLCNKPCLVISHRLAEAGKLLGLKHLIISPYNHIIDTLTRYQGAMHEG